MKVYQLIPAGIALLLFSMLPLRGELALIYEENFGAFQGSGLTPNGVEGTLDSNLWKVTGLSDGDGEFGGTYLPGGDFGRGIKTWGDATTGGVYAFKPSTDTDASDDTVASDIDEDIDSDVDQGDVFGSLNSGSGGSGSGSSNSPWNAIQGQTHGSGNTSLGFQPTGGDMSPGQLVFKFTNTTGFLLDDLNIQFQVTHYNDQDRSTSLDFLYSPDASFGDGNDDSLYTFETPLAATSTGGNPGIESVDVDVVFSNGLGAGEDLFLSWVFDDNGGSGSRDEIGITNFKVSSDLTVIPEPATIGLLGLSGLFGFLAFRRRRGN